MDKVLVLSFGEIMLKGRNRQVFINKAIGKVKHLCKNFEIHEIYQDFGKVVLRGNEEDYEEMIPRLKKVFGIVWICPCIRTEKDLSSIEQGALEMVGSRQDLENTTFKAEVQRADKEFRPKSPQMAAKLGAMVLRKYGEKISVDVHEPDFILYLDLRGKAYLYTEKIAGPGGLSPGSSGRGLLLLSGGIDSPVAGYQLIRRGVKLSALHFHSYPFTSKQGLEKSKSLAQKLTDYNGDIRLFICNLLPVYKAIGKYCNNRYMTILSRRFMMEIGERICKKYQLDAMITGESLGQVASQTIEGVAVINDGVNIPILRPLIAMDKQEIISIAKDIDTFETSILPFDDCCSVFTPTNPVTKPKLDRVKSNEEKLDRRALIDEVLENMEIIWIKEEDR
ncbi:MAG: tRNA uracil 4-sulfurtransferase ThiI [Tissierellia bacterium]|nr:tRNA uracil 4-sulfurtransferase ThiI [Tissierellia bacterium]